MKNKIIDTIWFASFVLVFGLAIITVMKFVDLIINL